MTVLVFAHHDHLWQHILCSASGMSQFQNRLCHLGFYIDKCTSIVLVTIVRNNGTLSVFRRCDIQEVFLLPCFQWLIRCNTYSYGDIVLWCCL